VSLRSRDVSALSDVNNEVPCCEKKRLKPSFPLPPPPSRYDSVILCSLPCLLAERFAIGEERFIDDVKLILLLHLCTLNSFLSPQEMCGGQTVPPLLVCRLFFPCSITVIFLAKTIVAGIDATVFQPSLWHR
jgi:hypothetical protein